MTLDERIAEQLRGGRLPPHIESLLADCREALRLARDAIRDALSLAPASHTEHREGCVSCQRRKRAEEALAALDGQGAPAGPPVFFVPALNPEQEAEVKSLLSGVQPSTVVRVVPERLYTDGQLRELVLRGCVASIRAGYGLGLDDHRIDDLDERANTITAAILADIAKGRP